VFTGYIIYRATIHVLYKYENVNSTIINYDLSDVMGEDPCSIEPGEKFVLTLSKVPGLQSLPHVSIFYFNFWTNGFTLINVF